MPTHTDSTEGSFDELSDLSLIRLDSIVKTPGNPHPLVDVSRSTWWRWVASGSAPEPVRPTAGTTLWRVGDLRLFLKNPEQFGPNFKRNKGAKS